MNFKEVKNRNFILLKIKKPFYDWITENTYDEYPKNLIVDQNLIISVPKFINEKNYEEGFLKLLYLNIFSIVAFEFGVAYEDEELDKINYETFEDFFDCEYAINCIDVEDHRPRQKNIRTGTYFA